MLEEMLRVAPPVAGVTLLADLAYDARPLLPQVALPTLVCRGRHSAVSPLPTGEFIIQTALSSTISRALNIFRTAAIAALMPSATRNCKHVSKDVVARRHTVKMYKPQTLTAPLPLLAPRFLADARIWGSAQRCGVSAPGAALRPFPPQARSWGRSARRGAPRMLSWCRDSGAGWRYGRGASQPRLRTAVAVSVRTTSPSS